MIYYWHRERERERQGERERERERQRERERETRKNKPVLCERQFKESKELRRVTAPHVIYW